MTTDLSALTHLEAAVWDLGPFLPVGYTDARAGLLALLDEADALCLIVEASRGSIADIDAPALAELMSLVAQVGDRVGRAGSYVELDHSTTEQSADDAYRFVDPRTARPHVLVQESKLLGHPAEPDAERDPISGQYGRRPHGLRHQDGLADRELQHVAEEADSRRQSQ